MPDWTKTMDQTFEYYIVDPETWRDKVKLDNVKSCSITRDSTVETLGSATIDLLNIDGECYVREYLVTIQNGITERFPLGTHLLQTPSSKFDGKVTSVSVDAYTPLIELKESPPPLGYSILKGENIMQNAKLILREKMRAPIVGTECETDLFDDFVANTDDTWLSFSSDLIANAKYNFDLDEMGRVMFAPIQDSAALQPVWTYDDGNSSILYPELSMDHDLYNIPNVVEVVYSQNNKYFYAEAVNDDPNSPTSTVSRGRRIISRITNPSISGIPSKEQIQEYAERSLKNASTLEYTISYTHAYCPVRVGDCVRLNYERAGLKDVKAKVVSQTIKCEPGCPVSEKAVYTKKLWG